jgi:DNA-binding transcriptional LysR family regulator
MRLQIHCLYFTNNGGLVDRIQPLRAFVRVAEMRSFTKAAASLGLPKASVSAQIRKLETEMGTRLLHRTTRQVQLTHDGLSFYERAKDLLADVDELATTFRVEPSQVQGRVRVGTSSRMARFEVIPKIPEFIKAHPRIQIELGATDRKVDLIHEGYDCVIRGGKLSDSSLIARQIGVAQTINVASPEYLKKHGTPKAVKDLDRHYLIEYVSSFGERADGFEYLDGDKCRSVKMQSYITVNSAEAYASACEAGLGIIQSPSRSLQESVRAGRLVQILPKLKLEAMPIYVLYPHRRNLPQRVRLFIEWIESILSPNYR